MDLTDKIIKGIDEYIEYDTQQLEEERILLYEKLAIINTLIYIKEREHAKN